MKDDLREVVDAVLAATDFVVAVGADGKISASDIPILISHAPGLITKGMAAVQDVQNVRIADLDTAEERDEFTAYVKSKFDIEDDATEEKVEEFVDTLLTLIGAAVKVVGFVALFRRVA